MATWPVTAGINNGRGGEELPTLRASVTTRCPGESPDGVWNADKSLSDLKTPGVSNLFLISL